MKFKHLSPISTLHSSIPPIFFICESSVIFCLGWLSTLGVSSFPVHHHHSPVFPSCWEQVLRRTLAPPLTFVTEYQCLFLNLDGTWDSIPSSAIIISWILKLGNLDSMQLNIHPSTLIFHNLTSPSVNNYDNHILCTHVLFLALPNLYSLEQSECLLNSP